MLMKKMDELADILFSFIMSRGTQEVILKRLNNILSSLEEELKASSTGYF